LPPAVGPRRARASRRNTDEARGREAERPGAIPLKGWKDILWRAFREIRQDDVAGIARGVAFSALLALFPALGAFVSLYGVFADPALAREQLATLGGFVPAEGLEILGEQMNRLATAGDTGLSLAFVGGLIISIWSANGGMKALFQGLNVAYEEREKRSFIRVNLWSLAFTLGAMLFFAAASGLVIVAPVALQAMHLDPELLPLAWLRWPALVATLMLGLALLYRYGPSRERARWRWISVGSVAASLGWIAGSALFSWYLANFANYDAAYGSLGALFGFMMWIWLSCVVVLCGAELNSEIEHQTAIDSTTGSPLPMGQRGATMADTLGAPSPELGKRKRSSARAALGGWWNRRHGVL
jgi:membrane protein